MGSIKFHKSHQMHNIIKKIKRDSKRLIYKINRHFDRYKRIFLREVSSIQRNILYQIRILCAKRELKTLRGRRFLELKYLLRDFLTEVILNNPDYVKCVCGQLLNVLKNCDQITYEDPGTVEAYALLHFLDRYHRFQIIFDVLNKNALMPNPKRKIDILDVGTGPGPSMYAISDFYKSLKNLKKVRDTYYIEDSFSIDYVERSYEFRNWLHHFTEYVNFYCPSRMPWHVPFHHGSFFDFKGIEFNQNRTRWDYDDDGDEISINYIQKFRFDLVIFSNFLTRRKQVEAFSSELKNCIRFLRNNGMLIIVGAKSNSEKYRDVYERISHEILSENYSNWKFIAKCEKLKLDISNMKYSWGDCYGEQLKSLLHEIYELLLDTEESVIEPDFARIIKKTIAPNYSKPISWEIHIFRKKAKMRRKSSPNRVAGGFSPPAPTPPSKRVRTRRFTEPTGP